MRTLTSASGKKLLFPRYIECSGAHYRRQAKRPALPWKQGCWGQIPLWGPKSVGRYIMHSWNLMLKIEKYTLGVGDRFAHQAKAQLRACQLAAETGVEIIPVWNKSNREHLIVGSEPDSVRAAADAAVKAAGWKKSYYVDADHINLDTVDRFIAASDFYTLDVAHFIGKPAKPEEIQAFVARHPELVGALQVPGIAKPLNITKDYVAAVAGKYLFAVQQAGQIYQH